MKETYPEYPLLWYIHLGYMGLYLLMKRRFRFARGSPYQFKG